MTKIFSIVLWIIFFSIYSHFSQIKFVYDDETTWCYGWSDGGKEDNRPVILVKGEFLTRVTHETLHNFRYAAAGVEFETNKGRIFSYQPLGKKHALKNTVGLKI